MKHNSGFITITFVIMIAAFLTFISLQANNDWQLSQTLTHVENFYEQEFKQASCENLEALQQITKDQTFISLCP